MKRPVVCAVPVYMLNQCLTSSNVISIVNKFLSYVIAKHKLKQVAVVSIIIFII